MLSTSEFVSFLTIWDKYWCLWFNWSTHCEQKKNELIYFDKNNQFIGFIDKDIINTHIKNNNKWIYRCVYCSLLTGDLLIGMRNEDSTCSKITRYTGPSRIQQIQYDKKGNQLYFGPYYITENNNGDVVVSDKIV